MSFGSQWVKTASRITSVRTKTEVVSRLVSWVESININEVAVLRDRNNLTLLWFEYDVL
jgi:hypothetical protein